MSGVVNNESGDNSGFVVDVSAEAQKRSEGVETMVEVYTSDRFCNSHSVR